MKLVQIDSGAAPCTQVMYVPNHILELCSDGDISRTLLASTAVEFGFICSWADDSNAYCKFFRYMTSYLRTASNCESAPITNLFVVPEHLKKNPKLICSLYTEYTEA